jgi:hypothetical protein
MSSVDPGRSVMRLRTEREGVPRLRSADSSVECRFAGIASFCWRDWPTRRAQRCATARAKRLPAPGARSRGRRGAVGSDGGNSRSWMRRALGRRLDPWPPAGARRIGILAAGRADGRTRQMGPEAHRPGRCCGAPGMPRWPGTGRNTGRACSRLLQDDRRCGSWLAGCRRIRGTRDRNRTQRRCGSCLPPTG